MATEDNNILRYDYCTELGSEGVVCTWTLLNLFFQPSADVDWMSPSFYSSKLLNTSWCLVVRGITITPLISSSPAAYTFKIKLVSAKQGTVRAVLRLSSNCGGRIVQCATTEPRKFIGGEEWGSLQLNAASLVNSAENKVIIKCVMSVLTEKLSITSSNDMLSPNYSLGNDFEQMLQSQELCDVTLKIGEQEIEYKAHKVILSARSPVFRAMFNTDMKENRESCFIKKDVDPNVFKQVLRYIYTGKCELHDGMAEKMLPFAHEYQLFGLKVLCEEALIQEMCIQNAVSFAIKASQFDCKILKRLATRAIQSNLKKVSNTDDWKEHKQLYSEFILDLICEKTA